MKKQDIYYKFSKKPVNSFDGINNFWEACILLRYADGSKSESDFVSCIRDIVSKYIQDNYQSVLFEGNELSVKNELQYFGCLDAPLY